MTPVNQDFCYDSHCHLSPDINSLTFTEEVKPILSSQTWPLNLMMTNHIDSQILYSAMNDSSIMANKQIMLNVGIHPWFSHLYTFEDINNIRDHEEFKKLHYKNVLEVYSRNRDNSNEFDEVLRYLPFPKSIQKTVAEFQDILVTSRFRQRINIGEVGLDKLARIPQSGYLGNPEYFGIGGLTNYKVKLEHQLKILELQLELAFSTCVDGIPKKISVHCVGCHGQLYNVLKKMDALKLEKNAIPAVVMHSYSGSVDNAKMLLRKLEKIHIWFGISDVVNLNKADPAKMNKLVEVIGDKLLVETDLGVDRMLEEHATYVRQVREKLAVLGVSEITLWDNWRSFVQDK